MDDNFTRLTELISSHLRIDPSKIKLEDNFEEHLGADSLDVVELVILIEGTFRLEIDDEVASEIKTVQDALNYIERFSTEK